MWLLWDPELRGRGGEQRRVFTLEFRQAGSGIKGWTAGEGYLVLGGTEGSESTAKTTAARASLRGRMAEKETSNSRQRS